MNQKRFDLRLTTNPGSAIKLGGAPSFFEQMKYLKLTPLLLLTSCSAIKDKALTFPADHPGLATTAAFALIMIAWLAWEVRRAPLIPPEHDNEDDDYCGRLRDWSK